jgi:hypothetical protein
MRIGVGIVLLLDLFIRSLSIKAFFTDAGVLPINVLKEFNWSPVYFSFHTLSGELWWQIVLFIINAICIILLIVGYRTRVFTFICWVFLTSIQNRNPFILQGGDDLLRILLFWALFLPWGERYSIKKHLLTKTLFFLGKYWISSSALFYFLFLRTLKNFPRMANRRNCYLLCA